MDNTEFWKVCQTVHIIHMHNRILLQTLRMQEKKGCRTNPLEVWCQKAYPQRPFELRNFIAFGSAFRLFPFQQLRTEHCSIFSSRNNTTDFEPTVSGIFK